MVVGLSSGHTLVVGFLSLVIEWPNMGGRRMAVNLLAVGLIVLFISGRRVARVSAETIVQNGRRADHKSPAEILWPT